MQTKKVTETYPPQRCDGREKFAMKDDRPVYTPQMCDRVNRQGITVANCSCIDALLPTFAVNASSLSLPTCSITGNTGIILL